VTLNILVLVALIKVGVNLFLSFQEDFRAVYVDRLLGYVSNIGAWLEKQGMTGAQKSLTELVDVRQLTEFITSQDALASLGSAVGSTFGTLASVAVGIVMVIILEIFILMEVHGTQGRIQAVKMAGGPDLGHLVNSAGDVQKYLGIKTLISALTGLLAGVLCWILGLKYPLLWAILAFVFNFIPAVGSTAACIPAVIEGLVQDGVGTAIGIAIGYGGINFCLDNFVQPALLGRRFGISPLVIILSVIFWGWLWGPVGMFLAVPLTMVGKVFLDNSEEFRWLSVAMSKKKIKDGEVRLEDFDFEGETIGSGASTEPPPKR
jgi:AI-2 transport protein TqsA